jgi:integrase
MKSHLNARPGGEWRWLVDLRDYRRRTSLSAAEAEALALLNERFRLGLKAWPELARAALARLLQPLYDVLAITGACRAPRNSAIHLMVEEMHQRQTTFWAWAEDEWLEVLCPSERAFHVRHRWSGNCRQYLIAASYLLCGFTGLHAIGTFFQYRLAIKVFGREAVDTAMRRVREELRGIGYGSRAKSYVPNALYWALLLNRSPRLEDITVELLEEVRRRGTLYVKRGVGTISHSLLRMGIIARPLSRAIEAAPPADRYKATDGVPAEWLAWCRRWRDTSTLAPSSRATVYYSALKVGRWLAHHHPDVLTPGHWTRGLALEYVAAVDRMKIGEWSNPGGIYANQHGKPLRPNAKEKHLGSVRAFFRDCQEWEWSERRFDPYRVFATPRGVRAQIGPDPRVIADDLWAKLLWAGLNLTADDLPKSYFLVGPRTRLPQYPFEMVRALAVTWLFGGLRRDELSRLRVGCVRWQREETAAGGSTSAGPPPQAAVCLLDVPVNKTSRAFTKPVDVAVGEAITAWEKVRLPQPEMLDQKTGELAAFLFAHRGRRFGTSYLNRSLIPMLCRKAGVPEADARGKITSHRARSTIASQLYNAKEPLSLFELQEWLGHASPGSTQYYARITPTKLMKSYERAGYFERNVRTVKVLLDQDAIRSGAAAGEPWKYYDLGHGYCTYDFFEQCPHRMACAKCSFYLPKGSSRAQLLEARSNLQHMLQEMPLRDEERAAVEDGVAAMGKLCERLADVPTPAGPSPRELTAATRRELPVVPMRTPTKG